eukprot:207516-Alexandrium_andersonii.AAC.1
MPSAAERPTTDTPKLVHRRSLTRTGRPRETAPTGRRASAGKGRAPVSYTHLRAHETSAHL